MSQYEVPGTQPWANIGWPQSPNGTGTGIRRHCHQRHKAVATLFMAVGSKDSLTVLYIDSDPGTQSERVMLSLTGV